MTAVRPRAPRRPPPEVLPGPTPRRVRPPRWLDLRLVLGVLLVLGSVLLGARIVSAADATVPVWAAAADLAAGTELDADDLVAVDVRLDDAADAYLSTGTRPEGRMLGPRRPGRRAAAALGPRGAGRARSSWPCPSRPATCRPACSAGQLVDVYAVADPAAGAVGIADGSVTLVVRRATVQAVIGSVRRRALDADDGRAGGRGRARGPTPPTS